MMERTVGKVLFLDAANQEIKQVNLPTATANS